MRRLATFALSLLGLFDSTYLFWVYTSPSHPMVCIGGGCDAVRASSYAHLWGQPVPVYGVLLYVALAALIFAGSWSGRGIQVLIAAISGAGFLFSLYLTGLEAFVINAWCAWCVVSALTVTAIFVLALLELRSSRALGQAAEVRATGRFRPVWRMAGVFLVAVVISIPAFRYLVRHGELPPVKQASSDLLARYLLRPESHAIGSPNAPLTVVEFGDFECPVCGTMQKTVAAIRAQYGDQIRFVFRQMPIVVLHAQAEKAAEASECAAEQGKFWEMADKLYANQRDLSEPALRRYGADLGLDQGRFNQCLASGETTPLIQRDVDDGHALNVHGTPTFFIGQHMVVGAISLAQFAQLIDQQLAARGTATPEVQASTSSGGGSPGASSGLSAAQANPGSSLQPASGGTSAGGQTRSDPSAAGSLTGGSLGGGNPFAQLGGAAALACNEDDARKKQPVLIRTDEAHQFFSDTSKTLFVDVRPASDYAAGHIKGAVNIPVEEIQQRWDTLPKNKTVVLYESGKGNGENICAAARTAGRILLGQGFSFDQVKVYQDGLAGWEKAGLPTER